jgi:thioester reductase-like protein
MSYFVTGSTGFIGRHLVEELLDHRQGTVFALVREGSRARLERMIEVWDTDRVVPVVGDLGAERLGVDDGWVE